MASTDLSDATRAVRNQAPPLLPVDLLGRDLALTEALEREGGGWGIDRLRDASSVAGSVEAAEHGRRAERNEPRLLTHDRYGNRIDQVELDPSWHWLLRGAIEREVHSLPWRDPRPGAHVVRGVLMMLWSNANGGVMCPVSMTYSAIPALRDGAPAIAAEWEERLTRPDYATGALAGMAMTERQGGSDVRANITTATPAGSGDEYELHGHKWFCSYPPCDVFLVLAQAPGGLSCFFVERGPGMEFQRLKDKLGTRSLPSSEVELRGIRGRLVGEEGRGVPAIIRMVNHTRLDCLLGSATAMRRGLVEAVHHTRHRSAFGALLADQPAMRNVLADLAIESEAATVAALRVARSFDADEPALRRFATAVLKFHVCKRAPMHAGEALECLGGNGYVEESGLPLLYRDAPLASIWEGSGNVAALDVLRAMAREPEGLPAFLAECELAAGADARLDAHLARVRRDTAALFDPDDPRPAQERLYDAQFRARRIVEDLGFALQASLLVRYAPPAVADAYCAARLGGESGRAYGTLPSSVDASAIIERALPA
ncbi:MAG TPA: acyl-CoA dehydrogenase family protein [Conexibacter sp.]|jgi:putative acyl-CoA dehydrogenase|nr:acyl-CoA dehydrogenase family protein [Conexibacter sp.]